MFDPPPKKSFCWGPQKVFGVKKSFEGSTIFCGKKSVCNLVKWGLERGNGIKNDVGVGAIMMPNIFLTPQKEVFVWGQKKFWIVKKVFWGFKMSGESKKSC